MPRITSITITRDNARDIGDCLDSVAFCDERIVVDSGSTDETVRIARERGAMVTHQDWLGFGPQKNVALGLAHGDWILWLDADERITPALVTAIKRAVAEGAADGYEISRLSTFLGRPMRHSGWHPDYVLRLFRRERGRWSDGVGHDRVICQGPVGRIPGIILHFAVRRIEDTLVRINRYSTAGAQVMEGSGRRVSFATGIAHGLFAFFRTYVLQLGFLDGREGFLLAVANGEGTYYRYMKAWAKARRHG
ncbi:MAG TPA: glycosyltransferase family 2 protein [Xanthobacteraceae bacterium]|jgi:glycosyltransferase involved in cell wall biosynthesis